MSGENRVIRRRKHQELSRALWKATGGKTPSVEPAFKEKKEQKKEIPEAFADAD